MVSLFSRASSRLRKMKARGDNNRQIKAMAAEIVRRQPQENHAPVIFFNASTRLSGLSLNAAYSLLASWTLRLNGTPVIHFACRSGLAHCVLGTKREQPSALPPCKECIFQTKQILSGGKVVWFEMQSDLNLEKQLQGLSLQDFQKFEYQGIPLGRLTLPSLRWILRCHDLTDDEGTRFLFKNYILSAWNIIGHINPLLDQVRPAAVVVFNGMFYPEASVRWAAQQKGIKVISHEVGLRPNTAFFTPGEATAYPIDIPDTFEMSPGQDKRLDDYLEQRFQGNFSMAGIRFWPAMQAIGTDFWQRVKNYRQVVPVFTNVVFDTSQGHANVLYPDMFAWLDQVLEIIKSHPETFFVIRAHPDECRPGKESRQSVAGWVRDRQVEILSNVLFVDAKEPFSSYELIQRSKFVMVYNSTIGLEASILGAAVLCGGKARFTQLSTVFFPTSQIEYRRMAEAFLNEEQIKIPVEYKTNARRFLYYQIFRTSLPFETFIEEDGIWKGYVNLKKFSWEDLLPENSATMNVIVQGILEGKAFLLRE